jgi:hypothetical protein
MANTCGVEKAGWREHGVLREFGCSLGTHPVRGKFFVFAFDFDFEYDFDFDLVSSSNAQAMLGACLEHAWSIGEAAPPNKQAA